jgi:hypothetical protein
MATCRELWKDGKLVANQIAQSDKLLMFAIDRLNTGCLSSTPTPDDILDLTHCFEDKEVEDHDEMPIRIAPDRA